MNNRRKLVIALGASSLALPFGSFAQQPAKIYRIGFLGAGSVSGSAKRVDALRASLRNLGYMEGTNIVIEFRWAEGKYDRLPDLAIELVRLKIDVLVTYSTPGTQAAKRATTTIPIVMVTSGDAVAAGLVASLARPGGNVTGSTFFNPDLMAKRLELLKEAMPRITRVAVLLNPDNDSMKPILQAMEIAARLLKLDLQQFEVRGPGEFESVFSAMAKRRISALAVPEDGMFNDNPRAIADLAAKQRLPSIGFGEFAEAGGLIGYGVNFLELYRRAAYFVDKLLKGAKPDDIPVEQPTKFDMMINMKTAKALGIKIPNSILVRADKVIE
jgi:putative ABC transport system substrate-binding protein